MARIIHTLFWLLSTTVSFSQNTASPTVVFAKDFSVKNSPYPTHIRIHYNKFVIPGMIIDLYSIDSNKFAGTLTNYVYRDKDTTIGMVIKQVFDREYHFARQLDTNLSTRVAINLLKSQQHRLHDSLIKFPENLMIHDCYTNEFEFKVGSLYRVQEIFCPEGRDDSTVYKQWRIFKEVINPNLVYIRRTLQLDSLTDFGRILPEYGRFYYNSAKSASTKKMPLIHKKFKSYEAWKNYRTYMKRHDETFDSTLASILPKAFEKEKLVLECPNTFYLNFSKKGRLQEIVTDSELWKQNEIDRYNRCKGQLLDIFKKINTSFINSEYGFVIKLTYDNEGYEVNTFY